MKKLYLLVAIVLAKIAPLCATHIVGGEFEILHLRDNVYTFKLIQYFDVVNGVAGAKDTGVNASIFRKRDNAYMQNVFLPLRSETDVAYTNPLCTDARLRTSRLEYFADITLSVNSYTDPEGYYIVYERCCRNNIISNIVSPDRTGQTFYLEFPPLMVDGEPFINSSPRLFPPLSDYACLGRDFYVDFRGDDPDGDSLTYKLVNPLNSSTEEALPVPTPGPHRNVQWITGLGANLQIPGNPALSIDDQGFMTITPSREGLFVFSVLCEEYREGIKIGEVRRDFQMLVIDCPDPGNPPVLVAKDPVTKQFKSDVLHVNFSLEDDRCVELAVTDKDGSESVRLRARPVNFAGNVQQYFSARSGNLSDAQDTLYSKFCFPDCPLGANEPIIFDIIAEDFTCPLPLKDTLRIIATVETIKNDAPIFENPVQRNNEFNVNAGDLIEFNLKAKDVNLDSMEMLFHSLEGNTLSSLGIEVDTVENMKGEISLQFNWDTDCNDFPFGLQSSFNWYFVVKDFNECGHAYSDTVFYEVNVQPAINTPPKLRIEGTSLNGSDTVNYTVYVGGEFTIDLIGIDDDEGDLLDIITTSNILTPENLGMDIQKVSGTQEAKLSLSWEPPCTLFETAPYMVALQFVLRDDNVCKNTSADTLNINVNVIPRPNRKPIIETPDGVVSDTLDIVAGESIDIDIKASDSDGDNITLSLLDLDLLQETLGIVFSEVSGQSSVSSMYEWQTNCDLLAEDFGEAVYPFTFVAMDDLCPNWLSDTLTMYVRVSDLISDADFLPPNVFTPNLVDDYNPEFYIPDLPADNCRNAFDRVVIYNRWGREVFESHDRNFSWDGEGMATGVYYMSIYYTRQVIKGTVSIIR